METSPEDNDKFQKPRSLLNKKSTTKAINNAFKKRSRGFLKKAVELSRLCEQRIFMLIFDPQKNKAI